MKSVLTWFCAVAGICTQAAFAAAGPPVALVEDVQGQVAGVEFMDYVAAGQLIQLGPRDSIVLGYLKSCWRETITGGTVLVGEAQSLVQLGRVERTQVACDSGRAQLGAREAAQSAATVFRSLRRDTPAAQATPQVAPQAVSHLVHGQSPLLEVGAQRGRLLIERLDLSGEPIEAAIAGDALLRDRFFDFARAGITLTPGGTYRASLGAQKLEFKIAGDAEPGPAPLVGRLLRFE